MVTRSTGVVGLPPPTALLHHTLVLPSPNSEYFCTCTISCL